jgi:RNA recognition motif-containing protein
MAKRLYVGNLGYSVTSEELQELFEQYGQVRSAQVLSDRETGRSRGFGFVEMESDADADAAIQHLDGNDHQGRRLTVNEARPRTSGSGGGDRSGYGGGGGGGYGGGGRGGYGGGGRSGYGENY